MNQKIRAIILLGLIWFTAFSCRPSPKEKQTSDTQMSTPFPIKVVKAERREIIEKLSFTGTIEPWQKMNIVPDISGKIARIYVKEGDRVVKGQLLAELDTQNLRLQLKQAEAALAAARANFEDARKNKERMDRLFQEKAISEQQYEKVKLAYEASQAQLEQAQAAVNLLRHNLEVSQMKAPFSGIVASKNANEGDVINPMMGSFSASSGVLTLMDFSRVKLAIEVSAMEIVKIRKGQVAEVRVPNLVDKVFKGEVNLVNLAADPATKKFKVEVVVDNPDLVLRPGTFGEVTIEVARREQALVVPQKAIVEDRFLFIVEGNRARKKEVTIGLQTATEVEILSGIQEGNLVIVEGNFGLVDGALVSIIGEVKP
ncbi:MAG: efflux RND transporter periplasmic adaptor subunit [Candidatus Aminicenantes bacterium]|nr:efflux RND transporter periplasmic adaptor subunit [Candidatus Aminicenantes bacterium]